MPCAPASAPTATGYGASARGRSGQSHGAAARRKRRALVQRFGTTLAAGRGGAAPVRQRSRASAPDRARRDARGAAGSRRCGRSHARARPRARRADVSPSLDVAGFDRPFQAVRIGERAGRKRRRQPGQQTQQWPVASVDGGHRRHGDDGDAPPRIGAGLRIERRLDRVDMPAKAFDHLLRSHDRRGCECGRPAIAPADAGCRDARRCAPVRPRHARGFPAAVPAARRPARRRRPPAPARRRRAAAPPAADRAAVRAPPRCVSTMRRRWRRS